MKTLPAVGVVLKQDLRPAWFHCIVWWWLLSSLRARGLGPREATIAQALWQLLLHRVRLGQALPGSELSWALSPWSTICWKTSAGSCVLFGTAQWVLLLWKPSTWLPWAGVCVSWSWGMCKGEGKRDHRYILLPSFIQYTFCGRLLCDSTLPGKGGSRNIAAVGAEL